ncbi:hypothetical protein SGPA1_51061 [Streptomyces misionensis JCM 4497]
MLRAAPAPARGGRHPRLRQGGRPDRRHGRRLRVRARRQALRPAAARRRRHRAGLRHRVRADAAGPGAAGGGLRRSARRAGPPGGVRRQGRRAGALRGVSPARAPVLSALSHVRPLISRPSVESGDT